MNGSLAKHFVFLIPQHENQKTPLYAIKHLIPKPLNTGKVYSKTWVLQFSSKVLNGVEGRTLSCQN